jgi:hypothetical protein
MVPVTATVISHLILSCCLLTLSSQFDLVKTFSLLHLLVAAQFFDRTTYMWHENSSSAAPSPKLPDTIRAGYFGFLYLSSHD